MLSLDNTYDEQEFFEFDQRLQRILVLRPHLCGGAQN